MSAALREHAGVYFRGVAMGAADAIPGVSGGTIALITGIYERLIDAIAGLSSHGPGAAADVATDPTATTLVRALRRLEVPFLLVLVLGVLTGAVSIANVLEYALRVYRAPTFAFFFGVILASPAVLRREVDLRAPRPVLAGVAGLLLAAWISGLPSHQADFGLPLLFVAGAVAICAMVLPGISGSLILLVVGAYGTMVGAVSDLTGALAGGHLAAARDPLVTIVVFALGALVGVLSFARAVAWALETHRVVTMTFLVGVMVGALRAPGRQILASVPTFTGMVTLELVVAGVVGAAVVLGLEAATGGIE